MKLIHLSDLHLGKRVNEFSMIEDQKFILNQAINLIDEHKPDGVLIAGDVYDKFIPPLEAVELFDNFLTQLSIRKIPVFIISGNHDSAERLTFGSKLMEKSGIYFAKAYDGCVEPVILNDDFGAVEVYLLPFIKPAVIKSLFPEEADSIVDYNGAIKSAIHHIQKSDDSIRKVLVAHQFVTSAERSDSEEIFVGGSDNVDASAFDDFDYVALGHIHGPQKICRESLRYSGSPLKYSFSEKNHKKGMGLVTLGKKGDVEYQHLELKPLRDMREIRGSFEELTSKAFVDKQNLEDYYSIILTDEEDIPDGFLKLQSIYKNLMKIEYDNTRTKHNNQIEGINSLNDINPLDIFKEFYKLQNNQEMSEEQKKFCDSLIQKIWGTE